MIAPVTEHMINFEQPKGLSEDEKAYREKLMNEIIKLNAKIELYRIKLYKVQLVYINTCNFHTLLKCRCFIQNFAHEMRKRAWSEDEKWKNY